jgi:hypothetical protein
MTDGVPHRDQRSQPSTAYISRTLGVLTGLVFALLGFYLLFAGRTTAFEEAAFGAGEARFAVVDGVPIHCKNVVDADKCISGASASRSAGRVLWLGNSQIHAINQRKGEDRSAPEILHAKLRPSARYLVTFSEPNANLQEHFVLFSYLLPKIKPQSLILPVVFDDFRETGLRNEIQLALRDKGTLQILGTFDIGQQIIKETENKPDEESDFAGVAATVQERSERALDGWLSDHWPIWDARRQARGELLTALYQLRNTVFRIKPTTSRKLIPGRYSKNWAALRATIALAQNAGVHVFLYVVPLRNDVQVPYVQSEYEAFKQRLREEFTSNSSVTLANLENVVANDLWGTKPATSVGGDPEYDFMHFQAKGHEALADALLKIVGANK